jgi:hypothetical protein
MKRLDRPGIFKADLIRWSVRTSQQSSAIAISIEFLVMAQLDGAAWADWTQYEDHSIYGDFWVVKSNGTINTPAVENLASAIGWNGDLEAIQGDPPGGQVQITVKEEEYNGQKRLKVAWINPGDFSPVPAGVSTEQVREMQMRFGSLLRAAAAGSGKPKPQERKRPDPEPKAAAYEQPVTDEDDLP